MDGHVGDTVVVESERVTMSARTGVIEKVLQQDPARYQVRWEDGRTSIFAPAAGVARIKPKRRPRAKSKT